VLIPCGEVKNWAKGEGLEATGRIFPLWGCSHTREVASMIECLWFGGTFFIYN
jgi:hypothetical protein